MQRAVPDLPPPCTVINEHGRSRYFLLCEHASFFIPEEFAGLGLSQQEQRRHIGWDIGAAAVAAELSKLLDATLVLANYSRLLIDVNRPLHSTTLIPEVSEATRIPGNCDMTHAQRTHRIKAYYEPFQAQVTQLLDMRKASARPTVVIGVHSFTPVFMERQRPWHAGILYRNSWQFGEKLVAALGGSDAQIASNEPYQIEDDSDYTVPIHGELRRHDAALVEIRQDLIADSNGASSWAQKLAKALMHIAAVSQDVTAASR